MDRIYHSLTAIHEHQKQDRNMLKWIVSTMNKEETFDSDDDDEEESLTRWYNVEETPAEAHRDPRCTPTPLAQKP